MTSAGRRHLDRGLDLLQQRRWRQAVVELEKAAAVETADVAMEAHVYAGWAYWQRGQVERAAGALRRATALGPCSSAGLLRARADLARHLHRPAAALFDYGALIALAGPSAVVLRCRALCWADRGEHGRSARELDRALAAAADPDRVPPRVQRGPRFLRLGDLHRAVSDASDALRADDGQVGAKTLLATALLRGGDLRSARRLAASLVANGSPPAEVDLLVGEMRELCGDHAEALARYTRALDRDPPAIDDPPAAFDVGAEARRRRGSLYWAQQHLQLALLDYDDLIAHATPECDGPALAGLLCERATIQMQLRGPGAESRALLDLSRAVRFGPGFAAAYALRGRIYADRAALPSLAMNDLDRALRLGLADPDVYAARARAFIARGDVDAALDDLDAAIALDAARHDLLAMRGGLRAERRETERALADFQMAHQLSPETASYAARITEMQRELRRPPSVTATMVRGDDSSRSSVSEQAQHDEGGTRRRTTATERIAE